MAPVKASDTHVSMAQLVMPNDTNPLSNLMGGNLLRWMDIASSISAMKLARSHVVTAAVDSVSFQEPIKLGDMVFIEARVTRSFNTSMEIHLEVFKQRFDSEEKTKCNNAFYTFVSLDARGRPKKVPGLLAESPREKELFKGALRRRELRLILGGRMKPGDAGELKSLFLDEAS